MIRPPGGGENAQGLAALLVAPVASAGVLTPGLEAAETASRVLRLKSAGRLGAGMDVAGC
jgi:hypothetical protein